MTRIEYKRQSEITKQILDKLPIKNFLKKDAEINDIMDAIQGAYEDHDFPEDIEAIITNELKGYVFNVMDHYEFMDYCTKKFKSRWTEEIKYYLWC